MKNSLITSIIFGAGMLTCTTAFGGTIAGYINETDIPLEADFVNLQFPFSFSIPAGASTGNIYGRIYEASMTPAGGASTSILAQLGIGPAGSDPRIASGWIWSSSTFNVQVGNEMSIKPAPSSIYRAVTVTPSGIAWITERPIPSVISMEPDPIPDLLLAPHS